MGWDSVGILLRAVVEDGEHPVRSDVTDHWPRVGKGINSDAINDERMPLKGRRTDGVDGYGGGEWVQAPKHR